MQSRNSMKLSVTYRLCWQCFIPLEKNKPFSPQNLLKSRGQTVRQNKEYSHTLSLYLWNATEMSVQGR